MASEHSEEIHSQKPVIEVEPPKLKGYCYSPDEAWKARDKQELLSIRIETSLRCNLDCIYCYSLSAHEIWSQREMEYTKILDVISQAHELGARSVVIIGGGEPTLYPHFKKLIKFIDSNGMTSVVFTNNTTMTRKLAKYLYSHNTSVIFKLDSLRAETQDYFARRRGTYELIMKGYQNLKDAGYSNVKDRKNLRLGASFVINRLNIAELPYLWRFCRKNSVFPNLEMMVPHGRARELMYLMPTREEWKKAKLDLLEIDRREFGFDWLPFTPLIGCGCLQVLYSLYLTVKGLIRPCAGIEVDFASVSTYSLKEIKNLPFFQLVRNIELHLKGKCFRCVYNHECIGCRGMAFSAGIEEGKKPSEAVCEEDPTCFYTP